MPRMIKHAEMGPYEVPEGTELPIYVCGCGLSKNKPFCDGSHKKTRAEAAGELYEYDADGNAKLVHKADGSPRSLSRCGSEMARQPHDGRRAMR